MDPARQALRACHPPRRQGIAAGLARLVWFAFLISVQFRSRPDVFHTNPTPPR